MSSGDPAELGGERPGASQDGDSSTRLPLEESKEATDLHLGLLFW